MNALPAGWGWRGWQPDPPPPNKHTIAAELLAHRAVLNLRKRRLIADVRARYIVSYSTAQRAVAMASRNAGAAG